MAEETALARIQPAARPLDFTEEQRKMIRDSFANGASDSEFAVLMEVAKARNLNPLLRQIHFVKRPQKKGDRWEEVWATQVSIDGLRAIAERTNRYEGQTPAQWCGPDGKWVDVWLKSEPPAAARVGVYKTGFREPAWGVARFTSYAVTKRDGSLTAMWAKMPDLMLAKCAEGLAIRKAFPEDTSGLYTDDEMGQAERLEPAPQPKQLGEALDQRINGAPSTEEMLKRSISANEEKQRAKQLVQQAAQVLEGEIVEEGPPPADEFLMPFNDRYNNHWEQGAPISSLETADLKRLAAWKAAKPDLKAACLAELATRGDE